MRVAAIVHVFYPEIWPEVASCIRNLNLRELIITYVDEQAIVLAKKDFPNARFIKCENRGYDVWPFLSALKTIDLDQFDVVVKLHTKRDVIFPHKIVVGHTWLNGPRWREQLLAFVKTEEAWRRTLRCLEKPNVGLVADRHVVFGRNDAVTDAHRSSFDLAMKELSHDWGLKAKRSAKFAGGTMFAVRAEALKVFVARNWSPEMFGVSSGHDTETYAHVLERILGLAVCAQGYRVVAFNGSVFWRNVAYRLKKFLFEIRHSERRHSIRFLGITIYRKKLK